MKNRWAYSDKVGNIFLDCKHCGITSIENFGDDQRGFMKKRAECTPCRRRTKEARDKIGTTTILQVDRIPIEVIHFKVSQARRFAYKDPKGNIYFICTDCSEAKHFENFYTETGGLLDKKSICKACTDANNKDWLEQNYERYRSWSIEYREENKERIFVQRKQYREINKIAIFESKKRYREENKEKIYYAKKTYREGKGKKKIKERIKKWMMKNPHKQRFYSQKRLARQKALPDTLTEEQLIKILDYYNYKCSLTGEEAHLDHVIPLFIGHGGTTYGNILPLSPVLNGSKQDKNIFEWASLVYKEYGFTLEKFNEVMTEVADRNDMTLHEYKKFYNWCFENPNSNVEHILKLREQKQEQFKLSIETAITMYVKGIEIKEIEVATGISNATIYRYLKLHGIDCNRRHPNKLEKKKEDI
ncbi:helix-turn-helix domain-containing protein [Peribacillus butanolivorans]|uniref:helix-turn-helix domain-containing protein n=1 Tax=Peribacillus butanolivorans TaxID=421767 RepID=UPI0030C904FF